MYNTKVQVWISSSVKREFASKIQISKNLSDTETKYPVFVFKLPYVELWTKKFLIPRTTSVFYVYPSFISELGTEFGPNRMHGGQDYVIYDTHQIDIKDFDTYMRKKPRDPTPKLEWIESFLQEPSLEDNSFTQSSKLYERVRNRKEGNKIKRNLIREEGEDEEEIIYERQEGESKEASEELTRFEKDQNKRKIYQSLILEYFDIDMGYLNDPEDVDDFFDESFVDYYVYNEMHKNKLSAKDAIDKVMKDYRGVMKVYRHETRRLKIMNYINSYLDIEPGTKTFEIKEIGSGDILTHKVAKEMKSKNIMEEEAVHNVLSEILSRNKQAIIDFVRSQLTAKELKEAEIVIDPTFREGQTIEEYLYFIYEQRSIHYTNFKEEILNFTRWKKFSYN